MTSRIVNAAGAWTALGASPVDRDIVDVVAEVLRRPVLIGELQDLAASAMRAAFAVEDGHVTACAASALVMAAAACMTWEQPDHAVAQLPDPSGLPSRIVIQAAHCCDFGAPVVQMVRLAGATVVAAGSVNRCSAAELDRALTGPDVAAAIYVASYETARGGGMTLAEFANAARARNVPIVLDMAGQTDFSSFLASAPDLAIISVHKALGGPTAGLLIGRADLIAAARSHDRGICRPMKVGKEGIAGAIAAIDRWRLEGPAMQERWRDRVERMVAGLAGTAGISAEVFSYGDDIPGSLALARLLPGTGLSGAGALAALAESGIIARPAPYPDAILLSPLALADDQITDVIGAIRSLATRREGRS